MEGAFRRLKESVVFAAGGSAHAHGAAAGVGNDVVTDFLFADFGIFDVSNNGV